MMGMIFQSVTKYIIWSSGSYNSRGPKAKLNKQTADGATNNDRLRPQVGSVWSLQDSQVKWAAACLRWST